MGILSNIMSGTRSINLAQSSSFPEQISIKQTPSEERVNRDELESAYRTDPICFNSINKAVQMIMSAGYDIVSELEEVKTYFTKFLEDIGKVGEDITFDEILESLFRYQMIYGNAFVELVFNKNMTQIVDLVLIDPKRMDYAKDSMGKILLDEYGKPAGYTLTLSYGTIAQGDTPPEKFKGKISLSGNMIYMLPQRICHFKLYTYGDRFYGLGMIEPAYKSILRKLNIEEAQSNSIYTRGTYPVIAYVGDETHDPTAQDIKQTLENLAKLKHDRYFAFQHWIKVVPLEVKQSDIVDKTLEYLRLNETASFGIPLAFATGGGEATNRATLTNQQKVLEFTLTDIANRTVSTIQKYIFRRISLYNKQKEVPRLKWGAIRAEEPNEKANRISTYIKDGVIKPEEVSEFVRKSEGLA
jgi:ribulose bisphosphate carboxylase small subunit